MPRQIMVDGQVVGVAPDDATDDELAQLAGELSAGGGAQPAPVGATAALAGAGGISETPIHQRRRIPGTSIDLPFSVEDVAEALPAAAATGAGLLATRSPGIAATLGGVAGEAGRQLLRRVVGAPAATGVAQRALGLDPDSPAAAAASLGGETAAGVVGGLSSKLLRALSGGTERSAERSIVRDILGGARNEREIAEAPRLAKRAQAVGVLRSMTKQGRLSRAQSALADANSTAARETAAARQAGATVEAGPVLHAIQDELPAVIPGTGGSRRAAAAERRATSRVLDDEIDAIVGTGGGASGTEVPVDVALGEIDALAAQLEPMYKRGALDPAFGKKSVQAGVKAFRQQLRAALPELADARMTQHELITITDMLQDQLDRGFTARGRGHEAASVAGAAAVGRYGPAGASIFSTAARTAAPLTIPGRQLLTKLLTGGAHTAQMWVRAANLYGIGSDTDDEIRNQERHRKAEQALQTQAEGVVAP